MKYTKKTHPRLYNTWRGMKARCNNPKQLDYKYYGGKGITVCEEWTSFKGFAAFAVATGYTDGLTIDRIDSTEDYNPFNCHWLSHSENVIRGNKARYKKRYDDAREYWLSISGNITATELASIYGVSYRSGWGWIQKFKNEKGV